MIGALAAFGREATAADGGQGEVVVTVGAAVAGAVALLAAIIMLKIWNI
jgi:hypothetical protein